MARSRCDELLRASERIARAWEQGTTEHARRSSPGVRTTIYHAAFQELARAALDGFESGDQLLFAANRVADAWHYGTNPLTRQEPQGIWHVVRDSALEELKRYA